MTTPISESTMSPPRPTIRREDRLALILYIAGQLGTDSLRLVSKFSLLLRKYEAAADYEVDLNVPLIKRLRMRRSQFQKLASLVWTDRGYHFWAYSQSKSLSTATTVRVTPAVHRKLLKWHAQGFQTTAQGI